MSHLLPVDHRHDDQQHQHLAHYPTIDGDAQRAIASAALANVASTSSESGSQASRPASVVQEQQQQQQHAYLGRAASGLVSGSSNGSQESFRTDSTSPKSVKIGGEANGGGAGVAEMGRPLTPERHLGLLSGYSVVPSCAASPPLQHDAKRTANGTGKATVNGHGLGVLGQAGVSRHRSTSRAAEISAQLKTKLAYAMVKVHNGWENQSIDQLEHLSNISTPSLSSPLDTSSRRRRLSSADHYMMSPGSNAQTSPTQFSPRLTHWRYAQYSPPTGSLPTFTPAAPLLPSSSVDGGPSLAPAAPIASGRPSFHQHRRSLSSRAPPNLITTTRHGPSDPSSQPTTPRRQGILRMPSQQAEKDALDSLLFMASPNNSSTLKYHQDSLPTVAPDPISTEISAAAKRVVFER